MKRTQLARRTPLRRGKPARVIEADIWREGLGRCEVCRKEGVVCDGRVDGHHVVKAQTLRKLGLHEFLMDKRNRLAVCRRRHEQHESRYRPIPRSLLPQAALDFAEELGLTYLIERNYPAAQQEAA